MGTGRNKRTAGVAAPSTAPNGVNQAPNGGNGAGTSHRGKAALLQLRGNEAKTVKNTILWGFGLLFAVTPFLLICLALPQFTGAVGNGISTWLHNLVGLAAWILPMLTFVAAIWCFEVKAEKRINAKVVIPLLFLESVFFAARCANCGGSVGQFVDGLFVGAVGAAGAWMIAVLGLVLTLFFLWQLTVEEILDGTKALGVFLESALGVFGRTIVKIARNFGKVAAGWYGKMRDRVRGTGEYLVEKRRAEEDRKARLLAIEQEVQLDKEASSVYEESGEMATVPEPSKEKDSSPQGRSFADFFDDSSNESPSDSDHMGIAAPGRDDGQPRSGADRNTSFTSKSQEHSLAESGRKGTAITDFGAVDSSDNSSKKIPRGTSEHERVERSWHQSSADGLKAVPAPSQKQSERRSSVSIESKASEPKAGESVTTGRELSAAEKALAYSRRLANRPPSVQFKRGSESKAKAVVSGSGASSAESIEARMHRLGVSVRPASKRGRQEIPAQEQEQEVEVPPLRPVRSTSSGGYQGADRASQVESAGGNVDSFAGSAEDLIPESRQAQEKAASLPEDTMGEEKLLRDAPAHNKEHRQADLDDEDSLSSLSPRQLNALSPEERSKALGLIRRPRQGEGAPSSSSGANGAGVQTGASAAGNQNSSFSTLSPKQFNALSPEERRQALGLTRRPKQGEETPGSSSGANGADGRTGVPAAGNQNSSFSALSPKQLNALSPEERRQALGLTRRPKQGEETPGSSSGANGAGGRTGVPTAGNQNLSFSTLSPKQLNALSPEERRQALGLSRKKRADSVNSLEAIRNLNKQQSGETACDPRAALKALQPRREVASEGEKTNPATFMRSNRPDLTRSVSLRSIAAGRTSAPAHPVEKKRRPGEPLTDEEKAAMRERAAKVRASFKRQAEGRARMREQEVARVEQAPVMAGAKDLAEQAPPLRPPAFPNTPSLTAIDSGARQIARERLGIIPRRNRAETRTESRRANSEAESPGDSSNKEDDRGSELESNLGKQSDPQPQISNAIASRELLNSLPVSSEPVERELAGTSVSEAFDPKLRASLSKFHSAVGNLRGVTWSAGSDLGSLLRSQGSEAGGTWNGSASAVQIPQESSLNHQEEASGVDSKLRAAEVPLNGDNGRGQSGQYASVASDFAGVARKDRGDVASGDAGTAASDESQAELSADGFEKLPLPAVSPKMRSSAERVAAPKRSYVTAQMEALPEDTGTSNKKIVHNLDTAEYSSLDSLAISEPANVADQNRFDLNLGNDGRPVNLDSIMPNNIERFVNLRLINLTGSSVYRSHVQPRPFAVRPTLPAASSSQALPSQPTASSAASPRSTSPAASSSQALPSQPTASSAASPRPTLPAAPSSQPLQSQPTSTLRSITFGLKDGERRVIGNSISRAHEPSATHAAVSGVTKNLVRSSSDLAATGVSQGRQTSDSLVVKNILNSGSLSATTPALRQQGFSSETRRAVGQTGRGMAMPKPVNAANSGSVRAVDQYVMPSLDLLDDAPPQQRKNFVDKSGLLIRTLSSFKVEARVLNVIQGPAVTRYELEPAFGVRVSKFINLTNDIALALAATSVRIEAPVPGKSAVGVEIPNESTELVALKDVLKSENFRRGRGLCVGLGKDITGGARVADLSKMPHLLVAGTTGSGKSVCINTLILSLIYRFTPRRLQILMIDPKQVELSIYEGLPHLVCLKGEDPGRIVVDPQMASSALNQMVNLMEERYTTFAKSRVRNIDEYNAKNPQAAMPWVVIIIDELADLMMVASKDVERSICRLAQKARAAGIHMVVATQRPSTDVITGLLKVNIPSRIAFAVSSGVDSRVILDTQGAEHLLGKGDMLFKPVDANEAARIQGAFVNNNEIQRVVEFWNTQEAPDNRIELNVEEEADEDSGEKDKGNNDNADDALIDEALEVILSRGQASASMLQTDLRVGYARARRLLNILEQRGYVGPADGSKARKILYTRN
ncbi:MAG: DNA translocase FtsK 4TM domain-containing protein [bacterium]|nr:DNA translocase FtsK 4TM domain-containing protein [bacterium]